MDSLSCYPKESYVMITGATGGLGKAFAVECASRGWNIFLTDLRNAPLATLGHSLRHSYGVEVQWRPCDLADEAERSRFIADVAAGGARFAGLINVAGGDVEGLFCEQQAEHIRMIVRLNVEAPVDLTHGLLRLRAGNETFRVVNIASLAAFYPMPYKATYAASKRFLLDFSLALREELHGQGVTVTTVCPAGMPTTSECIAAIEAQGLMGQLTTLNTGSVAARALDAAVAGRPVYIPGAINRFLYSLGQLVPRTWIARAVNRRWGAAHRTYASCQDPAPHSAAPLFGPGLQLDHVAFRVGHVAPGDLAAAGHCHGHDLAGRPAANTSARAAATSGTPNARWPKPGRLTAVAARGEIQPENAPLPLRDSAAA